MALQRDERVAVVVVEERPRAAQVAQALLADGRGEQDRMLRRGALAEAPREVQQRGEAEAVVADAGAVQLLARAPRLQRRDGREDGVEMGGDDLRTGQPFWTFLRSTTKIRVSLGAMSGGEPCAP